MHNTCMQSTCEEGNVHTRRDLDGRFRNGAITVIISNLGHH